MSLSTSSCPFSQIRWFVSWKCQLGAFRRWNINVAILEPPSLCPPRSLQKRRWFTWFSIKVHLFSPSVPSLRQQHNISAVHSWTTGAMAQKKNCPLRCKRDGRVQYKSPAREHRIHLPVFTLPSGIDNDSECNSWGSWIKGQFPCSAEAKYHMFILRAVFSTAWNTSVPAMQEKTHHVFRNSVLWKSSMTVFTNMPGTKHFRNYPSGYFSRRLREAEPNTTAVLQARKSMESELKVIIPLATDFNARLKMASSDGRIRIGRILEAIDIVAPCACYMLNREDLTTRTFENGTLPRMFVTNRFHQTSLWRGHNINPYNDIIFHGKVTWTGETKAEASVSVRQNDHEFFRSRLVFVIYRRV